MTNFFNFDFFGNNSNSNSKKQQRSRRGRTCRFEELEGREMLSVTPWSLAGDYAFSEQSEPQPEGCVYVPRPSGQGSDAGSGSELANSPSLSPLAAAPDPYDATLSEAEFNSIKSKYADLKLGNFGDYNIIVVGGANVDNVISFAFSENGLRAALITAANTTGNNLVVVHTDCQDTITLKNGNLVIPATAQGSVFIVSYGDKPLTLDGNNSSRVLNIAEGATVGLAGLTITNGNTGTATNYGGGIANAGTLSITKCTISGNTSTGSGGGIFGSGSTSLIIIANSTISGNSATTGGGGICNYGSLIMINTMILENKSSSGRGGGINVVCTKSTVTILNCTIAGNVANMGGGIMNNCTNSIFTVVNSTIVCNSASSQGGGIFSYSTLELTNCTIAGNRASTSGGGTYLNSGTLTINNTILAKNIGDDIQDPNHITIYGAHNLIGNGDGMFMQLVNGKDGNIVGSLDTAPVDPMFVSYTPYIVWNKDLWKDWDLRLAAGSQAIDKGSNALAVDANGNPLLIDRAGNDRIINGTVDIGAYEYGVSTPKPELPSTHVTTLADKTDAYDYLISLREAIAYAKPGDTITFDTSLYGKTIVLNGKELLIDKDIIIDGAGTNITIDANQKSRVFNIAAGATVSITGLTIKNGNVSGADVYGGGICIRGGELTITNCVISDNRGVGGGIFSDGIVTIVNCMIAGNTAPNCGGGIYNSGLLTLINSTIAGNTAPFGGGGIFISGGVTQGRAIIVNCDIIGNQVAVHGFFPSYSRIGLLSRA